MKGENGKKKANLESALKELDRVAKMLIRRDFELTQVRAEREVELRDLKQKAKDLEKTREVLLNILEDAENSRTEAIEERNKTMAIINNFVDGLLVFDKKNKLSLINPQAEDFFDVKSQDLTGKSILELSVFPTIQPMANLLGNSIKGVFRKEIKTKEDLILEVSTIPIIIEGEKINTLIILHDITREKIVEKMKTEFVSISAHQLRTPLSAIKWTLSMLLDGDLGQISPEQRDFIEKSYKSNEMMIALINDLLNVTRIEEGRYLYKSILTDLEPICRSVIDSYKTGMEKRKIKFEFKKPEKKLPKAMIDVEKIKLVIDNLLGNAVRYTPIGGSIKISLKSVKKNIEFSVRDSGVGIPQNQQQRIFSKFFRAVNVLKMETEGSGLGLFIAKNIIEAHRGRVWFESEEGKGTTFYFTIPIK
ncbi:MAG: ATP-binding protein [Patescibacteria group bacterium]